MTYADSFFIFDNDIRALLDGIRGYGILSGLVVSEQAFPIMGITVATGSALVGSTVVTKGSPTDLDIDAAEAYPRKDIVVIESDGTISIIKGTAEAISPYGSTGPYTRRPKPPDIPTDKVILAEVWVGANVTEIYDADITDRRLIITKDTAVVTSGRFPLSRMPDGNDGFVLTAKGTGVSPAYDAPIVYPGFILIWTGTIANIPSGWLICDGNNGTPNLLARFLEGVATAATDPGATGGATSKSTGVPVGTEATKGELSGAAAENHYHNISDIRPLYYDVAFLYKT